jgi:hypothetical protein
MKLYNCIIEDGKYAPSSKIIYVVAESYDQAEKILMSDKNIYWKWNFNRRIESIHECKDPVIIATDRE